MHREEGLSFARRRDVQSRRVLPDARRTASTRTTGSCGRICSRTSTSIAANVHIPRGDVPREEVDAECAAYEQAIERAGGIDFQILGIGKTGHIGFNEPGSGAESRTRLVHARHRHAARRRRRFLRRGVRAARGDHDGRRDDPRRARDRDPRDRRAQGGASCERAVEGEIDVEVAATFLQRHPNTTFYVDRAAGAELTRDRDAVAGRRSAVDGRARWCAPWSGCRSRPARRSSSSRSATTPSTSCRRSSRKYGSPGDVNGEVFNIARRQDPRQVEAAARPAHHLLLAAPGRRRHLDGRHPAQARRERERQSSSRT